MTPRDERDLERQLERVRFEPRASLGPEIRGRVERGEEPRRFPPDRRRILTWAGASVAAALAVAAVGLAAHQSGGEVRVDRCCQDLDGGGDADDGIVVVTRRGETVRYLKIYEDLDGSGDFSPGDRVRFIRQGTPVITGSAEGTRTTEFCCLDYDGGGPDDDALLVIARPPDRITMAALVERGSTARQPAILR